MNDKVVFVLVAIVLFLIIHYSQKNFNKYENWINYRQEPLGNINTAYDNNTSYYRRDRYRKPLNYPACHMVDYPVRHCKHFD